MRLSEHLRDDLVLTDLEADDVDRAIHRLAERLSDRLAGLDLETVRTELLERERAHTTAMGEGVALPHATIEGLEEPALMVARAREPVPFGPEESPPVWMFFVLLSPPGRERDHIKLLARICRLVRHPGFLEDLRDARSDEEMIRTIRDLDEQHV